MDRAEAADLLGVAIDADRDTVRDAFRSLIRLQHPDRAGASSARRSARLIEANRILRSPPASPRPPRPGPAPRSPTSGPVDARVDGDSLRVDAEPEAVLVRVVEAGHQLGEVTYLDRAAALVEILVHVQDEGASHPAACSLVVSLQGRADAVEVFCTVERLDGHPAPPVAALVRALGDAMVGGQVPFTPG